MATGPGITTPVIYPEPASAGLGEAAELAVIIPAYNERNGIGSTLQQVRAALDAEMGGTAEIIVVDDGSSDGTAEEAEIAGARVIRLATNRGYGAALKVGIQASSAEYVAILDADGTYPAEVLPRLFTLAAKADMVVGARDPGHANMSLARRPAKWFLTKLASYLAGQRIPDLNSGLRVMRRSVLERYMPILPMGFSFTTTITLALLCTHHRVHYEPITYRARIGSSKVHALHFITFVILVLRTVMLFNPLRVFLPLGALLFAAGLAHLVYDLTQWSVSVSAVLILLTAIVVWSLGFVADMIARSMVHLQPRHE
jgi:glycosyltransferase involved in cell wall biosynthesis